jgi:hypothetical protein
MWQDEANARLTSGGGVPFGNGDHGRRCAYVLEFYDANGYGGFYASPIDKVAPASVLTDMENGITNKITALGFTGEGVAA